jgi:hypothetical protein
MIKHHPVDGRKEEKIGLIKRVIGNFMNLLIEIKQKLRGRRIT